MDFLRDLQNFQTILMKLYLLVCLMCLCFGCQPTDDVRSFVLLVPSQADTPKDTALSIPSFHIHLKTECSHNTNSFSVLEVVRLGNATLYNSSRVNLHFT